MKIRTQLFATMLPVVMAMLGLLGLLAYGFTSAALDRATKANLSAAMDRIRGEFSAFRDFARGNGQLLVEDANVRQYVEASPGIVRAELLEPRVLARFRRAIESFDHRLYAVEIFDSAGHRELSLNVTGDAFLPPAPAAVELVDSVSRRNAGFDEIITPSGDRAMLIQAFRLGSPADLPNSPDSVNQTAYLVQYFDLRRGSPGALEILGRFDARVIVTDLESLEVVYETQPGLPGPKIEQLLATEGSLQLLDAVPDHPMASSARIGKWLVSVVAPVEALGREHTPLRNTSITLLLITLVGGTVLVGLVLNAAFARPIERLAADVRNRRHGEPLRPQDYARTDEIHDLAKDFAASMDSADAARAKAEDLANFDPLTGLANRRVFQLLCARYIAGARRRAERVALLFIDLDNFKHINDHYGHFAGDQLLVEFANRLKHIIRGSDLLAFGPGGPGHDAPIARIAGDEFAILVNLRAAADATVIAERILFSCNEPCLVEGRALKILTSIGIAVYPDDAGDAEQLYQHADAAMFQAKLKGKHGYYFFSSDLAKQIARRQQIQDALRRSLERDELHILCQPFVDADTLRLVGGEVLLRWDSAELGRVPPDEFIAVAESTGIIRDIDLWVFEQACRQVAAWLKEGLEPIQLSVNVSAVELRNESFPNQLREILTRYDLSPRWLELELTETRLVDTDQRSLANLTALRDVGFSIALDDFGKGYTSLNQLKTYPVNKLKIDRSFVAEVLDEGERLLIADIIMQLSKSYKLKTTAEGIEIVAQAEYMAQIGCDLLQGYLLSRPIPMEEITKRLREGRMDMTPGNPMEDAS